MNDRQYEEFKNLFRFCLDRKFSKNDVIQEILIRKENISAQLKKIEEYELNSRDNIYGVSFTTVRNRLVRMFEMYTDIINYLHNPFYEEA
jgi:hypothetical protein